MTDDYDWEKDAFESWLLAIREIRKAGVLEGKYQPITDEEKAWLSKSS